MMYKILIISLIIFFINEYFFKDKLLNFLGIAHKYFKTFMIILAIVAIYFSLKKEDSFIGKISTLSKINLKNPMKHVLELFMNNTNNTLKKDTNETIINDILSKNNNDFSNIKDKTTSKRSVSETKKKVVAHNQDWKCNKCNMKLPPSFEVHHVQPLHNGGSNGIDNLVALCRNCHGSETVNELIKK